MATISELDIILQGYEGGAISSINNLISSFNALRDAANIPSLSSLAANLNSIANVTNNMSGFTSLTELTKSLAGMKEVGNIRMTGTVNQLNNLLDISKRLGEDTGLATNIRSLADAMKPLAAIGKTNLGQNLTQLRKIPETFASLKTMNMEDITTTIRKLSDAMTPLADKMNAISRGFQAIPAKIGNMVASFNSASTAASRFGGGGSGGGGVLDTVIAKLGTFRAKMLIVTYVFRKMMHLFGGAVEQSNRYVENLNLFTVSMGDFADKATKHMNRVTSALGLSRSEWMANQSVFQQMATGFGISGEKAEIMSRNLTQLGYDLSSYFNVDIDTAMQKLQSGLSGQIKGLKAFGINVSTAAIQETALAYGVNKSTSAMSEAEKAMWRYVTIMRRSTNAQGDLARTLVTPANAMRIFGQQVNIMKMQLGNLVSVILAKVIPVIQLLVQALGKLFGWFAGLLGFKLPEIDYSGMSAGIGDVADNTQKAADSAGNLGGNTGKAKNNIKKTKEEVKRLKKELAGFDELNLLSFTRNKNDKDPNSNTGGSGGGGGGGGGGGAAGGLPNIKLPEYDMLKGLQDVYANFKKEVADLFAPMKKSWDMYGDIVVESFKRKFGVIKDLLRAVYQSFKKAWTGGRGERIVSNILNIIININDMVSALAVGFLQAWQDAGNGDRIMDALLRIVESVSWNVRLFSGILRDIARNVDFKPLVSAFADLTDAMADIIGNVGHDVLAIIADLVKVAVELGTKALPPVIRILAKLGKWIGEHPKLFSILIVGFATAKTGAGLFNKSIGLVQGKLLGLQGALTTTAGNIGWFVNNSLGMVETLSKGFGTLAGAIEGLTGLGIGTALIGGLTMATPLMAGLYLYAQAGKTEVGQMGKKLKELTGKEKDLKVMYALETDPKKKKALEKELLAITKKKLDIKAQIKLKQGKKKEETRKITKVADSYKAKIPMDMQLRQGSIKQNVKKTRDEARKIAKDNPITFRAGFSDTISNIKSKLKEFAQKVAKSSEGEPIMLTIDVEKFTNGIGKHLSEIKKNADKWLKKNKVKWGQSMSQKASWLKEKSQEARKKAQEWIRDHSLKFKFNVPSATDLFNSIKKKVNDAKAKIKNKLTNIKLKFSVSMDSLKQWINDKIIGKINSAIANSKIPKFKNYRIPYLASGGMVDTGQLFVARESGPELVGTMNGKNTVANNNQIISGVSEGVKRALLSVIGTGDNGGSTTQTINLVVDGETLAKVVNTYNSNQQLRYGV